HIVRPAQRTGARRTRGDDRHPFQTSGFRAGTGRLPWRRAVYVLRSTRFLAGARPPPALAPSGTHTVFQDTRWPRLAALDPFPRVLGRGGGQAQAFADSSRPRRGEVFRRVVCQPALGRGGEPE